MEHKGVFVEFTSPEGVVVEALVGPQGLLVGRLGGDADVCLAHDVTLSRRHGRLWLESGKLLYQDVGSANGSWRDGRRLDSVVEVMSGPDIYLGKTRLRVKPPQTTLVGDGMHVSLRGKADQHSLQEVFSQSPSSRELLALSEFIHTLLGSSDPTTLEQTLRRLLQVVPDAQRASLIAWPPREDGVIDFLVAPQGEAGSVSKSLASYAVSQGEALLFSEDFQLDTQARESALLRGIRSAVYVPLLDADKQAFGVLCVDSPNPTVPLESAAFHLIRAVASLLATALSTERLREESRRRELETRQSEARREGMANFLNIASHDLRNPLTVIRGNARIIERLVADEKIGGLARRIQDASVRAEGLINTYLKVTEVAGDQEITVDRGPLDLHSFVAEELEFSAQAVSNRYPDAEFINQVPAGLVISADPPKLRQILSNFISNGVKYSRERPQVTVGAREEGDEWVLWVADRGVGIALEDQQRLFQKFLRVGDRTLAPGTGLGLWLSSALVQAHGGRIWLESQIGQGTHIYFSLPKDAATGPRSC